MDLMKALYPFVCGLDVYGTIFYPTLLTKLISLVHLQARRDRFMMFSGPMLGQSLLLSMDVSFGDSLKFFS